MAHIDDRPRRRRPPDRTVEGGRRLGSAGSAVAVSALALLIGALLNAPGLHRSATIQPEGWKRDLALAVTEPLADVSDALLLNRPRRGLKIVLGRSDDDDIDTGIAVPGPVPTTDEPPAPAPPPPREKFSPQRKLRLWIAGDSLVVVPGESILRAVGSHRVIEPVGKIDGRIASGLERPDVFNWFARVREVMRTERPKAVVVMLGGNDDHDFMTGLPEGARLDGFGGPRWTAEYRRRVASIMDTVNRGGAFLVWIGLPITRDPMQTARYDTINAIVQTEAEKRPGRVSYLDTYFYFAGEDGGYAQYAEDDDGRLVKMRADDGVHFERAAGDRIAREALKRVYQRHDLTSWRRGTG
jgi:lysophospholipase L1-like esterase